MANYDSYHCYYCKTNLLSSMVLFSLIYYPIHLVDHTIFTTYQLFCNNYLRAVRITITTAVAAVAAMLLEWLSTTECSYYSQDNHSMAIIVFFVFLMNTAAIKALCKIRC